MEGEVESTAIRQPCAVTGAKSVDRDRQALFCLLEGRYARLQSLWFQFSGQLPANEWRLRLLQKALYSTWADLRALSVIDYG